MSRIEYRNDLAQLATRIPYRLHRAVKLAAIEEGSRVCDWVADALTTHLRHVAGTAADESGPQAKPARRRRAAAASA